MDLFGVEPRDSKRSLRKEVECEPALVGEGSVELVFVGRRPRGAQLSERGADISTESGGGALRLRGLEKESWKTSIVGGAVELRSGDVGLAVVSSDAWSGALLNRDETGLIGASSKISTGLEAEFVELRNGDAGLDGESSGARTGVAARNGDGRDGDGEEGDSGRRNGDLRGERGEGLNGVEDVWKQ